MDGEVTDYVDLVGKRADVMRELRGGWLDPRTVEERTGASRSTVNRALRSLAEAGLATREEGSYTLTTTGRLALDHHLSYHEGWRDLLAAGDVLAALPADSGLPMAAVVGAEPVVAPEETPYRPVQRLLSTVEDADRYRGVLPALDDPKQFRLLYEHVVTDGDDAELVVSPELRSSLAEGFPQRLAAMVETDRFDLLVGDVPEFGLIVTDHDGTTRVTVVIFGAEGGIVALLRNDTDDATAWASERYRSVRDGAETVTAEYRRSTDGGVADGTGTVTGGPGLAPALTRGGFVRFDRSFLLDRAVADPATAWRAGLDVAEVHTGYAIEREHDGETLTDRLLGLLADGEDVALIGPPGAGKSTTATRVACEWYAADRGPVFYRPGDRGTAFEAPAALAAAVEAADGHALVVVEDAVRPDAAAVFEAMAATDDADVSFLLDARESEWRDPPGELPVGDPDLTVETMPGLTHADYRRLVDRFEATADTSVDVSVERLRTGVRDSQPTGENAVVPGEMLLVTHRLSRYADPLSAGPTTLEDDAAAVYEAAVGAGDLAVDVAVAANLLNAAGIAVGPAHLRAVAGARSSGTVDGCAFEAALSTLDGRVLFGREGGSYRTVHETWSVAFLTTVLDREGVECARERAGRCLSAVLALADDADERDRLRGVVEDPSVDRIVADPSGWADGTVETLLALGRERPKVAPLLGDGDGAAFDLPDACESVTAGDCALALGRMFLDHGDFEAAAAAFGRLPAEGSPGVERLLGLARVASERGDLVSAEERAQRALALAEDLGDAGSVARCYHWLGRIAATYGDRERAVEQFERALADFRRLGDRRCEARTLRALGGALFHLADYERAREYLDRSIEVAGEVGDRQTEAKSLDILGAVAVREADYERAREYHERSLEIARDLGDRPQEASILHNLGVLADTRENYERAREYYERSLAIERELGRRDGVSQSLVDLGLVAEHTGDLAQAREYLERGLEISREVGDELNEGMALYELGEVARRNGRYDRAADLVERSRSLFAAAGSDHYEGWALERLGGIARERDDLDAARDHLTAALECLDGTAAAEEVLGVVESLARVERAAGDHGAAREWAETGLARIDEATAAHPDRRESFEALLADQSEE